MRKLQHKLFPSLFVENNYHINGFRIAGLDEVGRGCLFGPVVAAAVMITDNTKFIPGVTDSKKLSEKQRNELNTLLRESSIDFGIGEATAQEIDTLGIMQATKLAMLRAYWRLSEKPSLTILDGERTTLSLFNTSYKFVQGDGRFYSIAAAAILAKVYRDALITELSYDYEGYDLASNKGYGTKNHILGLKELGPSALHRKSFLSFLS